MIDMFDNVRLRQAVETVRLGLAGLVGQAFGVTTPGVTAVEVIGDCSAEKAHNVSIEGQSADLWFAPEQIELLDHAPGTESQFRNARLLREADGSWREFQSEDKKGR